jgi:ceramide glucosyltransferase
MIGRLLLFLAAVGLLSSTIYLALVVIAAWRYRLANREAGSTASDGVSFPPITILKPLRGIEPLLEESLGSFFLQEYPTFELILGIRDEGDPALKVAESLQQKYPKVDAKVILTGEPVFPNAKVDALEKMAAQAAYAHLVITDSDVRVAPGFLKEVVRSLLDSRVGLVTCLYRGVPTGGLWSTLEALGMSVEMSSGVLVAEWLEGMKFALGPAMATRQDVLAGLGGFKVLGSYCADDFVLGQLTYAAGKKVVLSRHVIDHVALNRSLGPSLLHQARWMRSTRFSRPHGHLGTVLTFATPFGVLGMATGLATGNWTLGFGLLSLAVLNRILQSIVVGWGVVRDPRALRLCWLYPVRDLLGFFLWCSSFCGKEIVWRGERYELGAGGKMRRQSGQAS